MEAQSKVYNMLADLKETLTGRERQLLTEIQERIPIYKVLFRNNDYKGKVNPFLVECDIQKSKSRIVLPRLTVIKQCLQ